MELLFKYIFPFKLYYEKEPLQNNGSVIGLQRLYN